MLSSLRSMLGLGGTDSKTAVLLHEFLSSPPTSIHTHPAILTNLLSQVPQYPPVFKKDVPDTWFLYENFLVGCLCAGQDENAKYCLEKLIERFGKNNERVMALTGLYEEATAKDKVGLERVLKQYEKMLDEDPTNIPIHKRLIALLTHLSQPQRAIANLTTLVSNNPTDAESWSELSHLYFQQGLYAQSIFCLEEILLIHPNAYNIFARLGEVSYVLASSKDSIESLVDSLRYYLRSIELCEDYLRAYYGLAVVTGRLLQLGRFPVVGSVEGKDGHKKAVDKVQVEKLRQLATQKLVEIVSKFRRGESGWTAYDVNEMGAAERLLEDIEGKKEPK